MKIRNYNLALTGLIFTSVAIAFLFGLVVAVVTNRIPSTFVAWVFVLLATILSLAMNYHFIRNLKYLPLEIVLDHDIKIRTWVGTRRYGWETMTGLKLYQVHSSVGLIPLAKHQMVKIGIMEKGKVVIFELKISQSRAQQVVALCKQKGKPWF